ncbi:MAG TPA: ATP synthase F1 subunit gamma [Holophagaceae bacterium]|nr:ATP synthase F1 subunit gamma [Holophagaceae bacterium]
MAGLQDIRRRIRSVKGTQQVTKALKMISAVKLRKSQERLISLRPYAGKMKDVVHRVVAGVKARPELQLGAGATAFISPREEKVVRVLVIASDKGLCGGFNANLLKKAATFLEEKGRDAVRVDVVGKRVHDFAKRQGFQIIGEHLAVPLAGFEKVAREVSVDAARQYNDGEIDALYVIYNHFHSAVSQEPTVVKVFPVELPVQPLDDRVEVPHLLEPDANTILDSLLPRYVEIELLRSLLESSASEHGARMAAMDKSSNNAGEMIAKLTLTMNKIRQASITNQIIEIVSGANA